MDPYRFDQSQALLARARRVIPSGIYGHYRHALSDTAPAFFSHAEGARFTDADGNEFVDWMCGWGPIILGYRHPAVEDAVRGQLGQGDVVSIASPLLVGLAERLVGLVDGADWALFGKNGGDVTSLSLMVARAATGRKKVVTVRGGYHGVAPWMQAPGSKGTIEDDQAHVLRVDWNRPEQLAALIDAHPGEIAAFISTPYHHPVLADNEMPADGYWREVQRFCNRDGIVLIVDDVRAGFRCALGGSHQAFGFSPDLVCFGKALGNGYPISALAGRDALREAASDVFWTGTQFLAAAPMAAALATLHQLEAEDAPSRIAETGRQLGEGLAKVAASRGYELTVTGVPGMPFFRLSDARRDPTAQRALHEHFIAECVRRGAYLLHYHNNFVSLAHGPAELERTFAIAEDALGAL